MHLVDTTMFFCPRGGGVKKYLLAKRAWLVKFAPRVRHTLLVPGARPGFSDDVLTCAGPAIPLAGGYRFPLGLARWRDALVELAPDVIEAGDPYVTGLAAREAGARLGIPVVAFCHSDLPRMLKQRVGSWIGPLARSYLRGLYRDYDLVLAPSATVRDKLESWGIHNTAQQPLGVDTDVFSPKHKDPNFRRSIGVAEDARLLVYAGRFAREKNLHVLTGAVEKLGEPYHLLMVGADRLARPSPRVTQLPYEGDAGKLARVLASCDALVHAGDQETFGLIVIEGMACGLPVAAVGVGGTGELVTDSVGVRAARPAVVEMAAAIDALFARDLARVGAAARERVLGSYSWNMAFSRLVQHYGHLAGQKIDGRVSLAHAEH
jgi:alpha-1,6-mannosyltransferase